MLKILIVEDEEIIRKGLMHTIDWLAIDCIIVGDAADGVEGLRLIGELKPDLVIADIKMPFMTGIEMLERASVINKFYSILLTSYSEFEYAKKAITLGVSEYLLKPVDEDKLIEIVQDIKNRVKQDKLLGDIFEKAGSSNIMNLVDIDIYISENNGNYYIREALNQIKMSYDQKISIESISADLGVSTSYLSRKFKETTSQTFLDVLNKYRIQKAIELLGLGKYRVNEISDMTGFSEYKHFCSVFKKYTQSSPTDFIKKSGHIIQKHHDI